MCDLESFRCRKNAAIEAFDEVGNANFDVDIEGKLHNITVSVSDCETPASAVPWSVGGNQFTINGTSTVLWTCNCRP